VRTTIKTFNQSKQSKAILKQLRLQDSIGRGLETIGKACFTTTTSSAMSVKRNLNPISYLCTNGQVEIKVSRIGLSRTFSAKFFFRNTRHHTK
jgi:hypothetical protein